MQTTTPSAAQAPSAVSEAEWETRVELAALYRVLALYGMTDLANQEVSARVKGEPDHFLTHPYGYFYEELRASDLVKVELDGNIADGSDVWLNDGAINLGKWIFGTREDVNFFIHGHCEDILAIAATETGLLPITQPAVYLLHRLTYIDYEFFEDEAFGEKFKKTLGDKDIMISHNHGYYALGRTAAEAFFRAFYLRQACSVQIKAARTGDRLRLIDTQKLARLQEQMEASEHYNYDGTTEWEGLLRKLERECPEYKT